MEKKNNLFKINKILSKHIILYYKIIGFIFSKNFE
jgi:hypothetical protein